jgi:hypothetical protein
MSSAPVRNRPTRSLPSVGRLARGAAWTALFAVLAAGAGGLLGQAWHAPGSPARAELTYAADAALTEQLDDATDRLAEVAADVERLADEAKTALAETASSDATRLQEALQRGGQAATRIDAATVGLRTALAGMPGLEPDATLRYSNAVLVRRSAIATAVEAASSLTVHWRQVAARASEAANLTTQIALHDQTVLDAAARGRARAYEEAVAILDEAILVVAEIQSLRERLIAGAEETVLDEWIARNSAYDLALQRVYAALLDSGGRITPGVQAARREEQIALANLPPDRRTIIVIVSEVTRGGLTQAVIAIEDARARIEEALAEAALAAAPSPTLAPGASAVPTAAPSVPPSAPPASAQAPAPASAASAHQP